MPNIDDIKNKYINVWSKQTYSEGLRYCVPKGRSKIFKLTEKILQIQNLSDKHMDGNSIQGIPEKYEGKINIFFTKIFWDIAKIYITPAKYIVLIVEECLANKITGTKQVAGIVGSGLRAFPSFIREMDLAYKMSIHFPNATITTGPDQDVNEHTDILIENEEHKYRLWSYQSSEKGLSNMPSKFCGERGTVPAGYHVLCPLNIKNKAIVEQIAGWYFYSDEYVRYIYGIMTCEAPDNYYTIKSLKDDAIKLYLKRANIVDKK